MSQSREIFTLADAVVKKAAAMEIMIATAESCTGGMIAAALTDIPGSSAALDRGFVTYSNEAKSEMLDVAPAVITKNGAVSKDVAVAMASGALQNSRAGVAISVTGVAGPTGGTPAKPVGLVWFGLASRGKQVRAEHRIFAGGGRSFVRTKTVETALKLLLTELNNRRV